MLTADITALKKHFLDSWTATPIVWDNQPETAIPEGQSWVRFAVRPGASFHDAGSSLNGILRQQGRVWLQVFVPEQTGDGAAVSFVEAFAAIFRNKRLDSGAIHLSTPDFNIDPTLKDGFFMISVNVPWESFRRY